MKLDPSVIRLQVEESKEEKNLDLSIKYLQKTLDDLQEKKENPTLNCPQCLTAFVSPKDHKCASILSSHYVCKVCDPLKLDPHGKIFHL